MLDNPVLKEFVIKTIVEMLMILRLTKELPVSYAPSILL